MFLFFFKKKSILLKVKFFLNSELAVRTGHHNFTQKFHGKRKFLQRQGKKRQKRQIWHFNTKMK